MNQNWYKRKQEADPNAGGDAPAEIGEFVGPEGRKMGPSWRDGLNEDIRGSEGLKDVTDVNALAEQFLALQKYQGDSIRIPSIEAGDGDKEKFYTKLIERVPGLIPTPNPDNPEAMKALHRKLGVPDEVADYKVMDDSLGTADSAQLRALAHKNKLSNAQYNGMLNDMVTADSEALEKGQMSSRENHAQLKKEWGITYDDKMTAVRALVVNTKAPSEVVDALNKSEIGPATLKWMVDMATSLGIEGMPISTEEGDGIKITPAEAHERIQEIMRNKDHSFYNMEAPDHQQAILHMVELQRSALGE